MSDSMRPKADDVVPPCMDFDNPGPHVWSWKFCGNCGKREPFASRETGNSAREDEIAKVATRDIREGWLRLVVRMIRDTAAKPRHPDDPVYMAAYWDGIADTLEDMIPGVLGGPIDADDAALTAYEEERTPPSAEVRPGEHEAIRDVARRAAVETVSRMSFLPPTFADLTLCIGSSLEFALLAAVKSLRTPSREGPPLPRQAGKE